MTLPSLPELPTELAMELATEQDTDLLTPPTVPDASSTPSRYRAGFVAIVGRPNVGKSTLMNALLGQKVAITSNRVQTTRTRIRGVLTMPGKGQIVFLDTPGFSKPLDKLGEFLTQEARFALEEAEVFLFVVDGSGMAGKGDQWLAEQLRATGRFVLLIVNKVDQVAEVERRKVIRQSYQALFEGYELWDDLTVSAKTGKRLSELPKKLLRRLPHGPAIYDEEQVTDQRMRDIAEEMIREKAMRFTADELPHSIAIRIEKYDESDPECTRITAVLYVEHTSQKGMLIGKGGQMIKKIGEAARKEIEEMADSKIFLDLTVKVKENWRKDPQFLREMGLS